MKVMAIFGAVIIMIGIYMIFAGLKMKKKYEIGTMIHAEEEVKKCKNKEGFISYIYWREIVAGVAMILLGAVEIANDLLEDAGWIPYVGIVIGIVALFWLFYSLKNAREQYI